MPRPANRRMPLSCEPCRERKIRCSRSGAGVCDACVRRGIPPGECIFLRDLRAQRVSIPSLTDENPPEAASSANRELLERVRKLEKLIVQPKHPGDSGSGSSSADMGLEVLTDASQSRPVSLPSRGTTHTTISDNGSLLSRCRGGYERYEPFQSQWSSALKSDALPQEVDSDIDGFTKSQDFPFSYTAGKLQDLLSLLPPVSSCDMLKSVYLDVFASLFHVLHDPTFCAEYSRFRADPESVSLSWLALLFSVLSVSVIALDEDSEVLHDLGRSSCAAKNVAVLTSRYRAAAMQCLEADHFLWRQNLHTLQALVVLIYGINHTHGQSWALLGLTRNVAFSLGCHIDPERFGLPLLEAEQRRRCWAALNMLYTIQNTTLGHLDPTPLPANVRLPMDVDDDRLTMDGRMPGKRRPGPSQMSYLVFKFRLYDICSRICSGVFSNRGLISYHDIMALDASIGTEQEAWRLQYCADIQQSSLKPHHAVHLEILFGYSHQLILLLHRPVLMQQHHKNPTISFTEAQAQNSRQRCMDSARALLLIQRRGYETPEFRPYRWYTRGLGSFHAFHAAVVIARIRGSLDRDQQESILLQHELEEAVQMFEAMAASGMSRISEKAVPILRYLCGMFPSPSMQAGAPIQMRDLGKAAPSLAPPAQVGVTSTTAETWDGSYSSPAVPGPADLQHLEMFLDSLQPQPWLSPAMINWGEWDSLMAGDPDQFGYGQS